MAYVMVDATSETPVKVTRYPEHRRPIIVMGEPFAFHLTDDEAVRLVRAILAALPADLHAEAIPTALARAVRA